MQKQLGSCEKNDSHVYNYIYLIFWLKNKLIIRKKNLLEKEISKREVITLQKSEVSDQRKGLVKYLKSDTFRI